MSMSENENQNHKEWDNLFPSTIEPDLPDDFSEEDVVFAQELSTLFSAPDEILPPYYAQTLLQAEDPRYTSVDNAFAQKTSARVFRALKLRRRLFSRHRSPLSAIRETLHEIAIRKSLLAWAAALMLIMMLTAAFTAPSFEQGISMLLHGSRAGVVKVHHAPGNVRHNAPDFMYNSHSYNPRPGQVPLISVGHLLSFPIYWPQSIPANYTLDSIKIYEDFNNTWADGPIVDLVYDIDTNRTALKGTGQIVVREFKPLEQVLQVVQDGNAYPIGADQYGDNPKAIYVDGQWMTTGKMSSPIWSHGGRSEVIYQQGDVVFWIAGDQRDGINQPVLWKMAQSLQTTPSMTPALLKKVIATILLPDSQGSAFDPFANDIWSIASLDGSNDQYYMTMSAYVLAGKVAKGLPHGR
jgi:hypothetical protein